VEKLGDLGARCVAAGEVLVMASGSVEWNIRRRRRSGSRWMSVPFANFCHIERWNVFKSCGFENQESCDEVDGH
jgi:hypothetical protein